MNQLTRIPLCFIQATKWLCCNSTYYDEICFFLNLDFELYVQRARVSVARMQQRGIRERPTGHRAVIDESIAPDSAVLHLDYEMPVLQTNLLRRASVARMQQRGIRVSLCP